MAWYQLRIDGNMKNYPVATPEQIEEALTELAARNPNADPKISENQRNCDPTHGEIDFVYWDANLRSKNHALYGFVGDKFTLFAD